ncbi:MAG: hypothetical protein K9I59_02690 [Chlorobium sp.]|jgi:hypothetical protein|uniref:DUF6858 family protein n=1 Tax=Chlorobium sp. TaxID=1095 RepID=UPI001D768B2A|nr:hypothetical protein [Chlorobium sp.]MBN1279301.1 hypothetical protein [Chlorobiaceae bacterium]MCF8215757.1 hypothetical protein [Chlorobium sp.]MCF8270647.1 hypothetical protein [Chlorobium sp.]MCF8286967.1 hypothetical protein [Chlorobium sp.]MCF8290624.1 hypothetical protein [Chlorobium sp.]
MIQTLLQEKYPIYTLELDKAETSCRSVDDIMAHFKEKIDANPVVKYIGVFDHYAHTSSLTDGVIAPCIRDARNILFCFGKELPNPGVLAVRPRSIGVAEMDHSFVITFLEAPNPSANEAMETWTKQLKNT